MRNGVEVFCCWGSLKKKSYKKGLRESEILISSVPLVWVWTESRRRVQLAALQSCTLPICHNRQLFWLLICFSSDFSRYYGFFQLIFELLNSDSTLESFDFSLHGRYSNRFVVSRSGAVLTLSLLSCEKAEMGEIASDMTSSISEDVCEIPKWLKLLLQVNFEVFKKAHNFDLFLKRYFKFDKPSSVFHLVIILTSIERLDLVLEMVLINLFAKSMNTSLKF